MSLLSKLTLPNENVLEENYYVLLETHILFLRTHPLTRYVEVTAQQAKKYRGDFHGLLDSMSLSKKYHYLITRINGLHSSTEFDGERMGFYIPSPDAITEFVATYNSVEV